jgi:hypothetical protein
MIQTFDDQLKRALDLLAERIRTAVADQVALTLEEHEAARSAAAAAAANAISEAASLTGSRRRLLQSFRALDASTSLSQTLDALAAASMGDAGRVALFLVKGDTLAAWSQIGFGRIHDASSFELPLAESAVIGDAVRMGAPRTVLPGAAGRPAFACDMTTGAFVAVPLTMNSEVIAVLCGEQPTATDNGEWLSATYEVLARHAARVLESLTALRLAHLSSCSGTAVPASAHNSV